MGVGVSEVPNLVNNVIRILPVGNNPARDKLFEGIGVNIIHNSSISDPHSTTVWLTVLSKCKCLPRFTHEYNTLWTGNKMLRAFRLQTGQGRRAALILTAKNTRQEGCQRQQASVTASQGVTSFPSLPLVANPLSMNCMLTKHYTPIHASMHPRTHIDTHAKPR